MPRKEQIYREVFRKKLSQNKGISRSRKSNDSDSKRLKVKHNIFLCECGIGIGEKGIMCGFCGNVINGSS